MEGSTQQQDIPDGIPAGAPESVIRAAKGEELNRGEERSALDWFLGATAPVEYDVPVQFETPEGMKKLIFRLAQVDGKRLEEIDASNRSGDGPFAKLDTLGFNTDAVAEATLYVADETGRKVRLSDPEFLGGIPSPSLALQVRFKLQPGILEGMAERIREKAGFGPDRVGTATRALVEAGKL